MVKILPYDPRVRILWSSPDPAFMVNAAAENTMKGIFAKENVTRLGIPAFLYRANHGSPLEHAVISFELTQISRACLDQLVRHRMGSFTSSSQHYQDHRDYPMRVSWAMAQDRFSTYHDVLETTISEYGWAIDNGTPKEDARMLFPMAAEVRVIWTINARSLANFINLRACRRNVTEMVLLATRIKKASEEWFPELFDHVGPDCMQPWILCRQDKMKCDFFAVNEGLKLYGKDES